MKTILWTTAAATLVVMSFADAEARVRKGGENTAQEQNLKLKAEWDQARRAGGYPDPISALLAVINGEPLATFLQPVINDPEPHEVRWPLPPGETPEGLK
jgi:hypothetical protein